jgi:hypothetical protein
MAQLRFREGFNPAQLNWGGPDEPQSDSCSCCDAPIPEDAVPLRIWNKDGWAIVLCDECVAKWITTTE